MNQWLTTLLRRLSKQVLWSTLMRDSLFMLSSEMLTNIHVLKMARLCTFQRLIDCSLMLSTHGESQDDHVLLNITHFITLNLTTLKPSAVECFSATQPGDIYYAFLQWKFGFGLRFPPALKMLRCSRLASIYFTGKPMVWRSGAKSNRWTLQLQSENSFLFLRNIWGHNMPAKSLNRTPSWTVTNESVSLSRLWTQHKCIIRFIFSLNDCKIFARIDVVGERSSL